MKSSKAVADQRVASVEGRIRPWCCSGFSAIYCPVHHDCSCPTDGGRRLGVWAGCPLHGTDTDHPTARRVVR